MRVPFLFHFFPPPCPSNVVCARREVKEKKQELADVDHRPECLRTTSWPPLGGSGLLVVNVSFLFSVVFSLAVGKFLLLVLVEPRPGKDTERKKDRHYQFLLPQHLALVLMLWQRKLMR